jgi:hypothetical protein
MSLIFPPIVDIDFAANDNQFGKQMIDAACDSYNVSTSKRTTYNLLYNAYNGICDKDISKYLTETYGQLSRTKFVRHRLGRSKMDLLDGEFLKLPLEATVITTNREAINDKFENITKLLGMAKLKPQIEGLREQGVNLFEGVDIPDEKEAEKQYELNLKSTNEKIMQHIIDDKVKNRKLKNVLASNFSDLKIVAECYGKIERDSDGVDTYRAINPKYSIFEEYINDPFLELSGYFGEIRLMSRHELLTYPGINFTPEEVKLIDVWCEKPNDYFPQGTWDNQNNTTTIPVYFLQWKGVETLRTKKEFVERSSNPYMRTVNNEEYNKNIKKYTYDQEKGKYEIITTFHETLWEGIRIGTTMYKSVRKVPYTMVSRRGGMKNKVLFDYVGLIFNTQNGTRVSLQEMITEIEMAYDIVMFQMRRELNKIKGKSIMYDKALTPKGETVNSVLYKLVEEGFLTVSSSDDAVFGNQTGKDVLDISKGIKEIDLGASQSLQVLLNLAGHYERMIDRITGINDNREGLGKATTTATGVSTSIEASRSITYPLFYFFNQYISEVLIKLCEKAKINPMYIEEGGNNLLLSDKDKAFLRVTKDISRDDYGISVGDARRFEEIKAKLSGLVESQINSKELRAHDVMAAEMSDTFGEYQEALEKGWNETKKMTQQMQQEQLKMQQEMQQQQQQASAQEKQQEQANLEKLKQMDIDSKRELMAMKLSMDADNKDKRLDHDDHHKNEDRKMDQEQPSDEDENLNFF